jgi:hypothetical protein
VRIGLLLVEGWCRDKHRADRGGTGRRSDDDDVVDERMGEVSQYSR